ncbi:SMP-30/gluconolactonase/LRE family protein [Pseudonocardia hydrocarbonoxydans]|uniref:Gluconolaconase n=1 Tax=Pseudonocardia hydrocarbonoxydans TaxID=76726 RepID=A0A4Y3WQ76_9PSEU|nr:SMP-30/gluconolactonase/LRE family protein [Pseudonocardia hydrocarbonoxydans]GEC20240.1 gluconolaconase [Pseudonocardia hydrocarbonoxydans]
MPTAPTVVLEKYSFLESPRWWEDRIWVSDFYTHRVLSAREDGSDVRVEAQVPGQPSGLGRLPDGRLLVVSMRDHRVLRREPSGELVTHADLSDHATGLLNDMVVDESGRAYVGNFGFDLMSGAPVRTASLVRVDPDGSVTVAATDLSFPNGAAFVDGELVVAETLGNRISGFPVDFDGSLGRRRDWARFGDHPTGTEVPDVLGALAVAPDGLCADVEGAVWVADALGERALRVRPQGAVVDTVEVGTGVYACALGGADGRTLFLCTAPGFAEHERRDTREAALLAVRVDVPAP